MQIIIFFVAYANAILLSWVFAGAFKFVRPNKEYNLITLREHIGSGVSGMVFGLTYDIVVVALAIIEEYVLQHFLGLKLTLMVGGLTLIMLFIQIYQMYMAFGRSNLLLNRIDKLRDKVVNLSNSAWFSKNKAFYRKVEDISNTFDDIVLQNGVKIVEDKQLGYKIVQSGEHEAGKSVEFASRNDYKNLKKSTSEFEDYIYYLILNGGNLNW